MTTQTATAKIEKWPRNQVQFFTNFDFGSRSESERKRRILPGIDSDWPPLVFR